MTNRNILLGMLFSIFFLTLTPQVTFAQCMSSCPEDDPGWPIGTPDTGSDPQQVSGKGDPENLKAFGEPTFLEGSYQTAATVTILGDLVGIVDLDPRTRLPVVHSFVSLHPGIRADLLKDKLYDSTKFSIKGGVLDINKL